jgi:hypothetical protein
MMTGGGRRGGEGGGGGWMQAGAPRQRRCWAGRAAAAVGPWAHGERRHGRVHPRHTDLPTRRPAAARLGRPRPGPQARACEKGPLSCVHAAPPHLTWCSPYTPVCVCRYVSVCVHSDRPLRSNARYLDFATMRHRLAQAGSPYTTLAAFTGDLERVWTGLERGDYATAASARQGERMRAQAALLLQGRWRPRMDRVVKRSLTGVGTWGGPQRMAGCSRIIVWWGLPSLPPPRRRRRLPAIRVGVRASLRRRSSRPHAAAAVHT